MRQQLKRDESKSREVGEWEGAIRNEINYYSCCLDEIRSSNDPEYKALSPIYESLLAHRQRQLTRFISN